MIRQWATEGATESAREDVREPSNERSLPDSALVDTQSSSGAGTIHSSPPAIIPRKEDIRVRISLPKARSDHLRRHRASKLKEWVNGKLQAIKTEHIAIKSAGILPSGSLEIYADTTATLERIIHNQHAWIDKIDQEAYVIARSFTVLMHGMLSETVTDMIAAKELILKDNDELLIGDILAIKRITNRSFQKPKSFLMIMFTTPEAANYALTKGLFYGDPHHSYEPVLHRWKGRFNAGRAYNTDT